ncbi:TPT-domain-containing protein [Metschnikowia bicuspidata]|uniref:TPT-domain-containing protein n=1 Tax=Metschnikowia bicuspidata TaxID=27322 RepID=A0A4P9ZHD4_9ASCO|nr:TPT-domain-containing protein [Metschnikowia bicuspidata]
MSSGTLYALVSTAAWFCSSVLISVYNKWMFGDGLNFAFPLFVTAYHQACLFLFSFIVLLAWPKLRRAPKLAQSGVFQQLAIPLFVFVGQMLPCALASAGDIGLGNASLRFIPLSLFTMVKTSSLIFVLIFGLYFRLEKFRWRLVVIVIIMCVSVTMMTMEPVAGDDVPVNRDHSFGLFLLLFASAILGLRWCFTQILLKKSEFSTNSILTIFYLAPVMAAFLFLFALALEGWSNFMLLPVWEEQGLMWTWALMTVPAVLAFMLTVAEFQLLTHIQLLTLSIAGIAKEFITIATSAAIFGDKLSVVNGVGLTITIINIMYYNYFRYTENDRTVKYTPVSQDDTLGKDIELDDQ